MDQKNYILFYGPDSCFSQFCKCKFVVDNVTYTSAEQFMMAKKAVLMGDEKSKIQILAEHNCRKIKALGRKITPWDDDKWNAEKENIVYNGNLAKFQQNDVFKKILIDTGDRMLVEASARDCIWGCGRGIADSRANDISKWRGQNLLGKILMKVRNHLKISAL